MTVPHNEYPRPQLERASWVNLNGTWQYAIEPSSRRPGPPEWDGDILVPFSPEAELSGVGLAAMGEPLRPDQRLWYRRDFDLAHLEVPAGGRVLLHFGAVDQTCRVSVNGVRVGGHTGGYLPFTLDITGALGDLGTDRHRRHELIVEVRDGTDASWHSRGKQSSARGGIWYTPQSGIWQTVWLEAVPAAHVERLTLVPDLPGRALEVTVHAGGPAAPAGPAQVRILAGGVLVTRVEAEVNTPTAVPFPAEVRPWSPQDPFLYDVEVTLGADEVRSYAGMRSFGVGRDAAGRAHLELNGDPFLPVGLLDQGYWPGGLYTAPTDAALEFDVVLAKRLGFTMLRKHIKIEPLRWYYHCDRHGMLVWQDAVNGGGAYSPLLITTPVFGAPHRKDLTRTGGGLRGLGRTDAAGREAFEAELVAMIEHLRNVVSLSLWVPFNEGWGQFDAARIAGLVRELDPTRPVDHASGWHDQGAGDLQSLHVYFRKFRVPKLDGRVLALTEYGGYSYAVPGHVWGAKRFGYKRLRSAAALEAAYRSLHLEQIAPAIEAGLAALVYTQLSDVEDEDNGLITYDRRIKKIPADVVAGINDELRAVFTRTKANPQELP